MMKKVLISLAVGCLITTGFSQSQVTQSERIEQANDGPKMQNVQVDIDYYEEMQRSEEKSKMNSFLEQSEKTTVVKDMNKNNSQSKIYSAENLKPNQIISKDGAIDFGQGKEQIVTRTKRTKKIGRVEGIVSREEIKKINGHASVSEEVLIRALGNPKRVEARSSKSK